MAKDSVFELSDQLYSAIVQGASVREVNAAIQEQLLGLIGRSRVKLEHVLSTAACRAYRERNDRVLADLLNQLSDAKDQYPFEIFINKIAKRGAYQAVWRAFVDFGSVLSQEWIAREKVKACKKILDEKNARGILYKLLELYPEDDVVKSYVTLHRCLTMRASGREADAQNKIEQIDPKESATLQPLAWELLRGDFTKKACYLVRKLGQGEGHVHFGRAVLDKGYPREAAEVIQGVLQGGIRSTEVEKGKVGFDLSAILLFADSALEEPSLVPDFLARIDDYESHGLLPTPYCESLRHYVMTGKKKGPNALIQTEKDNTVRPMFFTNPHDILRSKPINRVAGRVVGRSSKKRS